MNDTLLIVAISVIILGSLLLAGLAIWLAIDRNRHAQASKGQANQQSVNPAAKPAQPISGVPPVGQPPRPAPTPAPAAPAGPKAPEQPKNAAGPAARPAPDAASSGEYPAAALYDQTILPPPPKRRTRPQS